VRSADVIVAGGGIIGLSLAFELRKRNLSVLLLERGEPGREASHAAAGMLSPRGGDLPAPLQDLADASAALYPEFVQEVEDSSGIKVDLRRQGAVLLGHGLGVDGRLSAEEQQRLEPRMAIQREACFNQEASVDPRALTAALAKAALHHGVDLATGAEVLKVQTAAKRFEVQTAKATYSAGMVVNCCGAWSGQIGPLRLPTRPVKGQMLSVVSEKKNLLTHVIRGEHVYLVPRSDGRILIGATVEEAGFDKRVDPAVIKHLHQKAGELVPEMATARIHEAWAGLRPSTQDDLPILGATSIANYFVATGHFRNGILLAPVTAKIITSVICDEAPGWAIDSFASSRFLH
jgi:glycine oxidase